MPEPRTYKTSEAKRLQVAAYRAANREAYNAAARLARAKTKAAQDAVQALAWSEWARVHRETREAQDRRAAAEIAAARRLAGWHKLAALLVDWRIKLEPRPTVSPSERTRKGWRTKRLNRLLALAEMHGPPKPSTAVLRAARRPVRPPAPPKAPRPVRVPESNATVGFEITESRVRTRPEFVGPPKPPKAPKPPKVTREPRPALLTQPRPLLVGPPKPSRAVLLAALRTERQAAKAAQVEAKVQAREAAALDRAGKQWDRAAVALLRQAVQTIKRRERETRKRAYAAEQERRRRLSPEQREAEYRAAVEKREAVRLAALGGLAEVERQRIAEAQAAEHAKREAVARDLQARRAAALAAVQAQAAAVAPVARVGRVAFVPPSC